MEPRNSLKTKPRNTHTHNMYNAVKRQERTIEREDLTFI